MNRSDFDCMMESVAEFQGWRPLSPNAVDELFSVVSAPDAPISDEEVLKLTDVLMSQPGRTKAHLLEALKQTRYRLLSTQDYARNGNGNGNGNVVIVASDEPVSTDKPINQMSTAELESLVDPAYNNRYKQVAEMRGREQLSALASIELARRKYITPLQEARTAGKLPRTEVPGFAALGDLVPEVIR